MASLSHRSPTGIAYLKISHLGRCRTTLSHFARSFKSVPNRRGPSGLEGDSKIGNAMGSNQLFLLPQTGICTPTPTSLLKPTLPLAFPYEHIRAPSLALNDQKESPAQDLLNLQRGAQVEPVATPAYYIGSKFDRIPYWQKIGRWKDVSEEHFLSYKWNTAKDVQGKMKLYGFLQEMLPEMIPAKGQQDPNISREEFIKDVMDGIAMAPMSIRLTPHILASIDWENPLNDPLSKQFIPKKSTFQPDHPRLTLDSLHEQEDSPSSSHCPLYCRYCTRSYAVGADTETVSKASLKPKRARWNTMLDHIANTPSIQDVVISGGDSYSLAPDHLRMIGDRLMDIDHVRRFRVATKGLCVSPSRTLDPNDGWTDELIRLSEIGRQRGKHVALHTHFNHPNEFSWVSREAAQKLFQNSVVVRNQAVLLKGVNDDAKTMGNLLRELGDSNIMPYYVYAGDMVKGVEDLRTPLQTILNLECQLRGSIAGFLMPQFVVDLPGGGGKRLASSYRSYDRKTGVSTFVAPAVKGLGKADKVYEYFDPLDSVQESLPEE
ncbi:related to lysine 2,3-aminomutase [Rhynchosporium agropyri]|uniref:Related to lysine 2,3-aminomutase n=1 Tax=Rhynchosporium agropyri TaxID=914238 RepID=A0A1E1JYC7_9HELO|nr:related to lysine 2,3-aminomutase [Rhynchosporium agropyri]